MAPGENEQQVRPIDYLPDDSFSPASGQEEEREKGKPRPWIALAFSAVAVLVTIGAVSIFGSLEADEPEAPAPQEFASGAQGDPEAPPETLPPRLEDSLPNLTDRLTLVALVDDKLQTLLWDPSFRVPKAYDILIDRGDPLVDIDAAFDSGGRTLALTVTTPQNTRIYLGSPTDLGRTPDIVGATSLLWHASQVGAIAWVAPGPGGQWSLHTAKVDPLSGTLMSDLVATSFDTPVGLVRWDSAGFVLNEGSAVVAIDSGGERLWQRPGVAVSGSATIMSIIAPDDSASETRWVVTDRLTGDATDLQITGSPSEAWVTTSRDTDLIAEIAASTDRTRVMISGPTLAAPRIVQVDLDVIPVGFTSSGEYLKFRAFDSNDLVFVNWRTGATHTVPIPDNTTIIGSDLG
jgi:hypothetical protein